MTDCLVRGVEKTCRAVRLLRASVCTSASRTNKQCQLDMARVERGQAGSKSRPGADPGGYKERAGGCVTEVEAGGKSNTQCMRRRWDDSPRGQDEKTDDTSVARRISKGLRIGAAPRCGREQTESHESPWHTEPDNNYPAVRSAPFSPTATQVLCVLVHDNSGHSRFPCQTAPLCLSFLLERFGWSSKSANPVAATRVDPRLLR
jgi:hypothetical protein